MPALMLRAAAVAATAATAAVLCGAEEGGAPSTVHPASFYWQMAGAATSSAPAGFSFYTRIFSLFDEANPLDMQMGMGGTWLTPTNISWTGLPEGVCACNPKGWPSSTPNDPAEGCCEKDTRCSFLYETFEGGPGYWIGQLPTRTPKWRVNSAVGCYKDQTSTPLFNFGEAGAPHGCDAMGIAQLSNTMLMAPDGLTFEEGKEGMVGVSYARTPIGKVKEDDDRNFWAILVDTDNWSGPLAYFVPEFWAERWDSPNPSPGSAALGDLGQAGHGLQMGGGAFEWNTLYNYKAANGAYKIPKMSLPLGKDGQTTLFKDARGYTDEDIYDPLEAALQSGSLDASQIMAGGTPADMKPGKTDATYRLDGNHSIDPYNDAHLIHVGELLTTVDADGNARWAFSPNKTLTPAMDGKLPEYFSPYDETDGSGLQPISAADAPAELVAHEFPAKADMGAYDGLSHPPVGGCASAPGPADEKLYCAQTTSPSWIAFQWFKFVDQPAMARAKLSTAESAYLQKRVETLHTMLAKGGPSASKWIKERGAAEQLATVDGAQLVTPPKGMEVGYVPVVLYEGTAKPEGCSE